MITVIFLLSVIIYTTSGFWLYERAVKADMPDSLLIRFVILWNLALVLTVGVLVAAGVLLG